MTTPQQPGWYDDPNDPTAQRYWDGSDWTPHRQRRPIPAATPRPVAPPPPPLPPLPKSAPPVQFPPPAQGSLPPPQPQSPQWPPPGVGQQRSRSPRTLLIAVAGAVVLTVVGVLGYKYVLPLFASDEDQIKTVVAQMTNDFNNADGAGMAGLLCAKDSGGAGNLKSLGIFGAMGAAAAQAEVQSQLDENGTLSTSVSDVHVTGSTATATVVTTASKKSGRNTETNSFVKEGDNWKACSGPGDSN